MLFTCITPSNPQRRRRPHWGVRVLAFFAFFAVGIVISHAQSASDLLAQADQLANQGNWFGAAPLYAKAEAEFRKSSDTRNELYARIGRLHKDVQQGAYRAVREELERDLANPLVQNDAQLNIRALALKGLIDLNLNTRAASEDWQHVLAIATSISDRKWQNRANGELALVAGLNGQIGAAGIALYKALNTATQLEDLEAQVNFATWLGNGMAVNGMADRAVLLLDKTISFTRKSGYTFPLQLYIAKIRALVLLPEPQRAKARLEAKILIGQTLAQAQKDDVPGAETELLSLTAQMAIDEGDFAQAEASFKDSVRIAQKAGLPRMQGDALLHLSQYYRARNQQSSALPAIDEAVRVVQTAEEPYDLPLYIAEKAEVQAGLGNYRAAEQLYGQAMQLVDGLLVNAFSSRVKSSMIGAMGEIYLGDFRLAVNKLHDSAKAFAIIENARGRALLDSIRYGSHADPRTPQERKAESDIARLQSSLLHVSMSYVQTKHALAELDEAYDRLSPTEFVRNRREMEMFHRPPVELAALQRKLAPGECLMEYVLDGGTSFALSITRTGTAVHSLPGRKQIAKLVDEYLKTVKAKRDSAPSARALFRAVVQPVILPGISSIVIVPDGPLHLVPFEALIKDDGNYLLKDVVVSTSPSATVYYTLKTTRPHARAIKPFLGIAYSPAIASDGTVLTASANRGIFDGQRSTLAPLPYASEEIVEAAKIIGQKSVVLTGPDASEAILKAQQLQEFKVIHIAAHAIGDIEDPDREALVLSPGSNAEDGLWQAREIRRSPLNADLVVLSACETGTGRLQGEEGMMDLARTFLVAGAKSVVASLWSVDDRSTATLMSYFYRHLREQMAVAAALRHAKLDFIKEYGDKAEPYYWAGFVVVGDGTRKVLFETNKTDAATAHADF
jgi:CHAT domain-containing protein